MKLNQEHFKKAFQEKDLEIVEIVVNTLRFRFGMDHDQSCKFCCERAEISEDDYEELMMSLDEKEMKEAI